MKKLEIKIPVSDIYTEVKKLAEYKGKKQTDSNGSLSYDMLRLSDAEEEILDPFLEDGELYLRETLKQYLIEAEKEDGKVVIVCQMPQSWDDSLHEQCNSAAKRMLINYVASKWFKTVKQDMESEEAQISSDSLATLMRLIYYRKRP